MHDCRAVWAYLLIDVAVLDIGGWLKNTDAMHNFGQGFSRYRTDVVIGLQVQPVARLHVKKNTQTQSCVGGNGTCAVHDVANAAWWNIHVGSQLPGRDAHGFHELFEQNFAGVNFVKQCVCHG